MPNSPLGDLAAGHEKSGWDFSLWTGKNGDFILWANDETQEYQLFKNTNTRQVEEDIILLGAGEGEEAALVRAIDLLDRDHPSPASSR